MQGNSIETVVEHRDGMKISWQVPIKMDDGLVLRADVFEPPEDGQYPVILSYGPYGKGISYQEGYPKQWNKMIEDYPEISDMSSNKYQSWETIDPEIWVPHGYVVIRIDSRGAGSSPGVLDVFCTREYDDICECIEWAGTQPNSTGKVGMLGISYYSINQWKVAEMAPPHLAAILPWEGNNDHYRDGAYHGGILSQFSELWSKEQIADIQHGRGTNGRKNPNTDDWAAGDITLDDETLRANRTNYFEELKKHPFDDEWHGARTPDLSKITVPLLSSANWGGQGIHPRGNFNGYVEASSKDKWLEVHGDSHWSLFSAKYGFDLQRKFFDHYLKGEDNGWKDIPPVILNIRHPGPKFVLRYENEWPIARTEWTKFYLDLEGQSLATKPREATTSVAYDATGDGLTFSLPPLQHDLEITGPMASKLFISSSTEDADLFLILRVFDPEGQELTFMGSTDPNTPIANGWLRASHRELDDKRTKPYQPFHPHERAQPLVPGQLYECDVELVPSCIVVPAGWTLALTVRGKDYVYDGPLGDFAKDFHFATRGTGNMTHNDKDNRPEEVFANRVTLHSSAGEQPYVLLPVIPSV